MYKNTPVRGIYDETVIAGAVGIGRASRFARTGHRLAYFGNFLVERASGETLTK
jgi:hypothetical protein